jgi:D-lactate dehydrogenase
VRVAVFSTKPYDRRFLDAANSNAGHKLVYLEPRLVPETAPLTTRFPAV